jgi:hypothetical protein
MADQILSGDRADLTNGLAALDELSWFWKRFLSLPSFSVAGLHRAAGRQAGHRKGVWVRKDSVFSRILLTAKTLKL